MILLALSCTRPVALPDDTGEETDSGLELPVDGDGDGYPRWDQASDPALADCDDHDPEVTPATERLVSEGPFIRGEEISEWNLLEDTEPIREIWLSPYCADVTEVTNEAFVRFMEAQRDAGMDNQDASGQPLFDFEDDDDSVPERILEGRPYTISSGYEQHPVTEVWVWSGQAYCASLGKRLPTEAEWEKAARGDQDERTWPWGEGEPDCERANIRPGPEGADGPEPCVDDTVVVGSYVGASSPYGLVDMAGNVGEWVSDWYQPDYYAWCPDTDPPGPDDGWVELPDGGVMETRVTRGGSFASSLESTTVGARYLEPAEATSNGVGFRCVRPL